MSSEKLAVVTGATSGIGRAVALGLARLGFRLVLLGRDRERLEEAVAEGKLTAIESRSVQIDLASADEIQRCARSLRETAPAIDVLIHAAGRFAHGPLESMSPAEFDALYHVNVRAPWLLTCELLPLLRAAQGQVVFVNSSAVFSPPNQVGAYAAMKAALRTVADGLRIDVNADGLRVLTVFPGRTATPMQERIHQSEGKDYRPERLLQPDDVAAAILSALSLPRTAEVTEISIRPRLKS